MKILIVDDSKATRMIVKRTLRQAGFEGHEFSEAADGWYGYQRCYEWQPDLILCDWHMPNMSGLEFLQKLKAEANTTRFGFISSGITPEMRHLANENGAAFFIGKPFTAAMLQSTLGTILA